MKTKLLLILLAMVLLSFAYTEASAQQTHRPGIIPYSQFAPDTMAYLEKNFVYAPYVDFYNNRPIKDLLEDLFIAVKTTEVTMNRNNEIRGVILYVFPNFTWFIDFLTPIKPEDGERYQRIIDKYPQRQRVAFDDELRKWIEPLLVKEAHLLWVERGEIVD